MTLPAPELRLVDVDAPEPSNDVADRLLDATLVLVARWGVGKTALADVAKEAGCSRATLYRAFPGGKRHLLNALAVRELAAYQKGVLDAVDNADTLEDALTMGLVVATRLLHDHDAAQFILTHEPGLLLPFLGFHEVDNLYRHVAPIVGAHLERFLPPERATWAAEWVGRVFVTYLFNPQSGVDLADVDDARALITSFVLPAFAVHDHVAPVPSAT